MCACARAHTHKIPFGTVFLPAAPYRRALGIPLGTSSPSAMLPATSYSEYLRCRSVCHSRGGGVSGILLRSFLAGSGSGRRAPLGLEPREVGGERALRRDLKIEHGGRGCKNVTAASPFKISAKRSQLVHVLKSLYNTHPNPSLLKSCLGSPNPRSSRPFFPTHLRARLALAQRHARGDTRLHGHVVDSGGHLLRLLGDGRRRGLLGNPVGLGRRILRVLQRPMQINDHRSGKRA